jgi:hypothetical protein
MPASHFDVNSMTGRPKFIVRHSTKNCQGFSNELSGCSGANLNKSGDVANFNFIKSKDVANKNTVKCGGKVFKKCTFNFY